MQAVRSGSVFPDLHATALAALGHYEVVQYRAVGSGIDAAGFVTKTPGAWADLPGNPVVSHQPTGSRETAADGDRVRGSMLVCLGPTGPGQAGPPIGVGDELLYAGEVWVVGEIRDYSARSRHRELVCGLRDA